MTYANLDFTRIEKKSRQLVMQIAEAMLDDLKLPTDIKIKFTNSRSLQKGEATRHINLETKAMRFTVQIPKTHGSNDSFMLFCLAHELIHVRQYWTGKLESPIGRKDDDDVVWTGIAMEGKWIRAKEKESSYFTLPWEKEANNDGMALFYRMVKRFGLTVTTSFLKEYATHKKYYCLSPNSVHILLDLNDNYHRGLKFAAA